MVHGENASEGNPLYGRSHEDQVQTSMDQRSRCSTAMCLPGEEYRENSQSNTTTCPVRERSATGHSL